MKTVLKISVIGISLLLFSCKEKSEVAQVFDAQYCLNAADETIQSELLACLSKIEGNDSPEANSVRCSILITAGGVTSDRVVTAMTAKDVSQTAMMTVFSFNKYSSGPENKLKAKEAKAACKKSEEKGLIGLSGFSSMGTLLCNGGSNCDATTGAAAETILTGCRDANCTADDKAEIGETVLLMNEQYCSGANSETPECLEFKTAIGGVDPNSHNYNEEVFDKVMAQWLENNPE